MADSVLVRCFARGVRNLYGAAGSVLARRVHNAVGQACTASWLNLPLLCTTLPMCVKFSEISVSMSNARTDCTVSSSMPPNT